MSPCLGTCLVCNSRLGLIEVWTRWRLARNIGLELQRIAANRR